MPVSYRTAPVDGEKPLWKVYYPDRDASGTSLTPKYFLLEVRVSSEWQIQATRDE